MSIKFIPCRGLKITPLLSIKLSTYSERVTRFCILFHSDVSMMLMIVVHV